MYRVDRDTLRIELELKIRTVLRVHKSELKSKMETVAADGEEKAINDILSMIDNPSSCVVRTEMIHYGPGHFGEHEPWPAETVEGKAIMAAHPRLL